MAEDIDQLVLGCTHYPFLERAIRRVVGSDVAIIDPSAAVARQTSRVLAQRGLESTRSVDGPRREKRRVFVTTGDARAFAQVARRLVGEEGRDIVTEAVRWREGRLVEGVT